MHSAWSPSVSKRITTYTLTKHANILLAPQEVISLIAFHEQEEGSPPLHMSPALAPLFSQHQPHTHSLVSSLGLKSGATHTASTGKRLLHDGDEQALTSSEGSGEGEEMSTEADGCDSGHEGPALKKSRVTEPAADEADKAAAAGTESLQGRVSEAPPESGTALPSTSGPSPFLTGSWPHHKLRTALFPPDLGHVEAMASALGPVCLPQSDVVSGDGCVKKREGWCVHGAFMFVYLCHCACLGLTQYVVLSFAHMLISQH